MLQPMEEKEIKVGSRVFVEQAWEDQTGNYHDEYATVKAIDQRGRLSLTFDTPEVTKFLQGAEYRAEDVELVTE